MPRGPGWVVPWLPRLVLRAARLTTVFIRAGVRSLAQARFMRAGPRGPAVPGPRAVPFDGAVTSGLGIGDHGVLPCRVSPGFSELVRSLSPLG
jgi:hypothetical protein